MTDFDFNMDMRPKNTTKETQETNNLNEADETVKRKQSDESNVIKLEFRNKYKFIENK